MMSITLEDFLRLNTGCIYYAAEPFQNQMQQAKTVNVGKIENKDCQNVLKIISFITAVDMGLLASQVVFSLEPLSSRAPCRRVLGARSVLRENRVFPAP